MMIIKIGGGKHIRYDYISDDVAELIRSGQKIIIVHGAGAIRDEIAIKMGHPQRKITSPSGMVSNYTDHHAIDIFLMVYAGIVNKKIVATLRKHGVNAIGLSGVDGGLWQAKRKEALYAVEQGRTHLITDTFTGSVVSVNTGLLDTLMNSGYVPVICPPAITDDGTIVNVDNDMAIATMCKSVQVSIIISLFEEAGMLHDFEDKSSVISVIRSAEIEGLLEKAMGTMKKKLLGAKKSLEANVSTILLSDGRVMHPITRALQGAGTTITK